jgi:phytoene dehydrogenase-like protein
LAAHSTLPLEQSPSAAFALVLAVLAHHVGWPFALGGSQSISNALASHLRSLGGEIVTGNTVQCLDDLPEAAYIFCDVTPSQLLRLAGKRLPQGYRQRLAAYKYGPGVCKVDWALSAPIPWAASACSRAGTVHLGGGLEEIEAAERAPHMGLAVDRPLTLLTQPTLFDPSRAPASAHVAWAYCHVPNGSSADASERIEQQVERFARGFSSVILKRHVVTAAGMELQNPNLVGGDISGGAMNLKQLFFRPTRSLHRTPVKGLYICSSSTPPGGGVHGMCGHLAALSALREEN